MLRPPTKGGGTMTETLMPKVRLGRTDLMVSPICFGTSGLGDMPATFGYSVSVERAAATVNAILDGPTNFIELGAHLRRGPQRGTSWRGAARARRPARRLRAFHQDRPRPGDRRLRRRAGAPLARDQSRRSSGANVSIFSTCTTSSMRGRPPRRPAAAARSANSSASRSKASPKPSASPPARSI